MGRTPACLGPDFPSGVAMVRSYAVDLWCEAEGDQKSVGDREKGRIARHGRGPSSLTLLICSCWSGMSVAGVK